MIGLSLEIHLPKLRKQKLHFDIAMKNYSFKKDFAVYDEKKQKQIKSQMLPPWMQYHELKPLNCKSHGLNLTDLMGTLERNKTVNIFRIHKRKSKISIDFHKNEFKGKCEETMKMFSLKADYILYLI
ncbi:hypothetical protein SteCoe_25880 [Stentor coeruleus]|uniref:Uncharacterized protein n=1 Tax=Stentor coeruleus TaxID=5963 RepID=A0A1R2BE73_9CILI|nr:hypothetical protein SteCoe_25880 [Stentor coeruleus]